MDSTCLLGGNAMAHGDEFEYRGQKAGAFIPLFVIYLKKGFGIQKRPQALRNKVLSIGSRFY